MGAWAWEEKWRWQAEGCLLVGFRGRSGSGTKLLLLLLLVVSSSVVEHTCSFDKLRDAYCSVVQFIPCLLLRSLCIIALFKGLDRMGGFLWSR